MTATFYFSSKVLNVVMEVGNKFLSAPDNIKVFLIILQMIRHLNAKWWSHRPWGYLRKGWM